MLELYDPKYVKRRMSAYEKRGKKADLSEVLSIGVTSWFRDPAVWESIDNIIQEKDYVKAVSIGCSTGEEVYSLAFLCSMKGVRYNIVGIDMNEKYIETARGGYFDKIPRGYESFFDKNVVKDSIKLHIKFVHGNVFDVAIPPANLVLCRNVLIYLNTKGKEKLLDKIISSMLPGAYLVLGASEMLFNRRLTRISSFLYRRDFDGQGSS